MTGRRRNAVLVALAALGVVTGLVVLTGPGAPPAEVPTPSGDPVPGFPDASTTGVPDGVELEPYEGPCTVREDGAVIDAKVVDCRLVVLAADVVVSRSRVNGPVDVDSEGASLTIEDSVVDGGTDQGAAVGYSDVTVLRSEIRGAAKSVSCGTSCRIEDSWLHGQFVPDDADWHLNAYLSSGGSGVVLRGNTIACDARNNAAGGGCTSAVALFGDFSGNRDFLIEGNLLVASPDQAYCVFAGTDPDKPFGTDVQRIVWRDNVFDRGDGGTCGAFGPVTSYDPAAPGNQWVDNVWADDGSPVLP